MNAELVELYGTMQRLADDVSHEFRTPLSVIKGYSEIIQSGMAGPLSAEQTLYSQLIVEKTRDLAQMTDNFLNITRLCTHTLHMDRRPCAIGEILAAAKPMVDFRVAGKRIQWVEEVEGNLPKVFADCDKAAQIIVNLAAFVVRSAPERSKIVLAVRREGPCDVRISVTDEGPGISPEELTAISKRFGHLGGRGELAIGKKKGLGLGLSIAKELAMLNLGRIAVAGGTDNGNTFSFTLPVDDLDVVIARWCTYLDFKNTGAGTFAVLRVTPEGGGKVTEQLWKFIANSIYADDVVLPAADGGSLIVFGYTESPAGWVRRLGGEKHVERLGPVLKTSGFTVELVAERGYPLGPSDAATMVRGQISGAAAPA